MTLSTSGGAERFHSRKFSEIATDILRERIMSGALAMGDRINEVALSDELGVSRPPLREALRVLSGEGLVHLVPGKGAYVTEFDVASFLHVAEVRLALEVEAARLAAERIDSDGEVLLKQVIAEIHEHLQAAGQGYPHHVKFHHAIAEAAGNPHLASAVGEVLRQVRLPAIQTNDDPQRAQQVLREHRAVAEAILQRDPEAAANTMRAHINANTNATAELLRQLERKNSR